MRVRGGFTTVELMIVLALLAALLGSGWLLLRPPAAVRSAQELARVVRHARWSAVASGSPTVLLTPDDGRTVVVVQGVYGCDASQAEHALSTWEAAGRKVALAWPQRGVAFGPDGFPRSCSGDGVGSATALLSDLHGGAAAVIVSSLGRVRWERRP